MLSAGLSQHWNGNNIEDQRGLSRGSCTTVVMDGKRVSISKAAARAFAFPQVLGSTIGEAMSTPSGQDALNGLSGISTTAQIIFPKQNA